MTHGYSALPATNETPDMRPGGEPVAWMDDFGNVFPLSANKGAGSWLDEHRRNWKPLYVAHPAPAEPVAFIQNYGEGLRALVWNMQPDDNPELFEPLCHCHPAPAEPPMDEREWLKAHESLLDSLVWAAGLMGKFGGGEDKTKQARDAVRLHLSRRVAVDRDAVPTARPISEYNDDHGSVLWWAFPVNEPPYSGAPTDDDWPGYHTHWTSIVVPKDPTS